MLYKSGGFKKITFKKDHLSNIHESLEVYITMKICRAADMADGQVGWKNGGRVNNGAF